MKNSNCDIVIPFDSPWDWSADFQRQTCLYLAKKFRVYAYMQKDELFVLKVLLKRNTIHYPEYKNIKFVRPLFLLPGKRFPLIRKLNIYISFKIFEIFRLSRKRILWIFDPIFYNLSLCFKGISLYDCVDYAWSNNQKINSLIQNLEKKLIKSVDYFFVNSKILSDIHTKVRKPDRILPQGFRIDDYKNPIKVNLDLPKDKPIIGLVGAINHRLNYFLLNELIKNNPQWHFVLWGKIQEISENDSKETIKKINKLLNYPNVTKGESKNRKEVPSVIDKFTISMIPYDVSLDAVKYCYPMKLFEYFYQGKPVISTDIVELRLFSKYVKIGQSVKEWEYLIKSILDTTWSIKYQHEQRLLALENSWENKISSILSYISI